ncbi:unnamed protein product, partial [Laminaria digitata]
MHNREAGKLLNFIVHSVLVAPEAGQMVLGGHCPQN